MSVCWFHNQYNSCTLLQVFFKYKLWAHEARDRAIQEADKDPCTFLVLQSDWWWSEASGWHPLWEQIPGEFPTQQQKYPRSPHPIVHFVFQHSFGNSLQRGIFATFIFFLLAMKYTLWPQSTLKHGKLLPLWCICYCLQRKQWQDREQIKWREGKQPQHHSDTAETTVSCLESHWIHTVDVETVYELTMNTNLFTLTQTKDSMQRGTGYQSNGSIPHE